MHAGKGGRASIRLQRDHPFKDHAMEAHRVQLAHSVSFKLHERLHPFSALFPMLPSCQKTIHCLCTASMPGHA